MDKQTKRRSLRRPKRVVHGRRTERPPCGSWPMCRPLQKHKRLAFSHKEPEAEHPLSHSSPPPIVPRCVSRETREPATEVPFIIRTLARRSACQSGAGGPDPSSRPLPYRRPSQPTSALGSSGGEPLPLRVTAASSRAAKMTLEARAMSCAGEGRIRPPG